MNFKTFKNFSKNYTAVPVYRCLLADTLTPVSLFLNIRQGAKYPFLLESVEGGEQLARYSFLGRNPYQVLRYRQNKVTVQRGESVEELQTDYFSTLQKLTTAHTEPNIPDLPRFTGGAVGFSGYDTVRNIESLHDVPENDLQLPDAVWAFYDEVFAFDHVKQQIILIKTVFTDKAYSPKAQYEHTKNRLDKLEKLVYQQTKDTFEVSLNSGELTSNVPADSFTQNVETAKDYIYEGDIFQVVLSQRFEMPFEGDRFMLYRTLRMVNPSPYLFYLDFGGMALVGSSPELLVRVQKEKVTLLPIAGTRGRGETPEEDRALEEELKNDPKEVAEHVMLLDLGRNDLSRVCEPGSVQLGRTQAIVRYSHVMHMVSELHGRLRDSQTAVDALMKTFPAGTVSGAPKIRAMEIIDELETTKRGPYAGAVGYFDFSGNMDTCIAIRTMVISGGKVYIQAGAGIVADSNPEKEYKETKNKAAALVEALDVALKIKNT